MAPILDPTTARKFEASDPKVAQFVDGVSTHERDFWLSYLVLMGLNEHLGRFITASPFIRGTHLDTRIIQLIHQSFPDLNALERGNFRVAVQQYIRQNHLISNEFDYREPERWHHGYVLRQNTPDK